MKPIRLTNVPVRASQNPEIPDNHEHGSGENEGAKVDRIVVAISVSMLIGSVAAVLDFVFLQMMVIQIHWLLIGFLVLVVGFVVKTQARKKLVAAGFASVKETAYLQIVKDQKLVTDGLYKHIRHPVYSGDVLQKYGWVIMLSSLYGALFVTIGLGCYLVRIRNEEKMLVEAFGDEYRKYQETTKKLIPYIY